MKNRRGKGKKRGGGGDTRTPVSSTCEESPEMIVKEGTELSVAAAEFAFGPSSSSSRSRAAHK